MVLVLRHRRLLVKTVISVLMASLMNNSVAAWRSSLVDPKMVMGLPVGKHFKLFAPNKDGVAKGKWNGRDDNEEGEKEIERKYTPVTSDDDVGHVDLVIKVYRGGVLERIGAPPDARYCRPDTRNECSTRPNTRVSPCAIRAAMLSATSACTDGDWRALYEPQSTITRAGSCSAASESHTPCTASSEWLGPDEPPCSTTWQSRLPVVSTMPATPCLETERKACGAPEARTASSATRSPPRMASRT